MSTWPGAEAERILCRRKTKASMAKVWQKIYEANYHKSLDHRSFYFKQVSVSTPLSVHSIIPIW